ncbi:MAG TPA: ABC transporter ATP-binding protein [Acidobacteriota bacterium]|nr:ABC transporter ATP-binding protein [Acidobacteriota bacterium]
MSERYIEVNGVSKRFGTHLAVDRISFDVDRGGSLALLGPNGAGKTTTVRMLACLLRPSEGSIRVFGKPLDRESERQEVRKRIGLLTESPGLYDRATAWYNLLYFARLYGLEHPEKAVEKYLRRLELWDRRNDVTAAYSKGMKQRLAIARALLHEPDIIFLDEPTSGLDPAAAKSVRDFLQALKEQGRTLLMTTHNLLEAERLADRIAVVQTRLLALDSPVNLRRQLFGHRIRIQTAGVSEAQLRQLENLEFIRNIALQEQTLWLELIEPEKNNSRVISALVEGGVQVIWVEEDRASLEDIYLQLIRDSAENAAVPSQAGSGLGGPGRGPAISPRPNEGTP